MGKKDWHDKGQKDRAQSCNDGWLDIIITGGSSPHYNPPSDSKDQSQYKAGWKNAEKKKC